MGPPKRAGQKDRRPGDVIFSFLWMVLYFQLQPLETARNVGAEIGEERQGKGTEKQTKVIASSESRSPPLNCFSFC